MQYIDKFSGSREKILHSTVPVQYITFNPIWLLMDIFWVYIIRFCWQRLGPADLFQLFLYFADSSVAQK